MLSDGHLINTDKLKTVSLINCSFHKNSNLKLVAIDYDFINIAIIDTMFSSNIWNFPLINVPNILLIFYGSVKFINNTGDAYLLNVTLGVITCYNYIGILHNHVKGFLYSHARPMINLEENTNLEVKHNIFSNNFAVFGLVTNPYPYCLFQYFSKNNYDKMWHQGNYSISFTSNYMKPLPYSYIAGCEWLILKSAFKTSIPLEVNKRIIIYKNNWPVESWINDEKEICICETFTLFNCTISNLGPVYPGETLVAKFAIPYYWNYEYHGMLNIVWNRDTTCQFNEITPVLSSASYRSCSVFNITILTTHDKWCALVLYSRGDVRIKPAVFYVMLYPGCPMGFTKNINKCNCDQILSILFTFTCNINDRTILRPGNSWISATTNNDHSHNYTVCQVCPFDYCLPHSSHLHLSHPNSQCQFNRSGLLCGQGLSTVLDSSQCEHCSNVYLLLVLLFALLGISLVFVLFAINITVTNGTINAFVFYVNIVSINGTIFFPLHQFSYVLFPLQILTWASKCVFTMEWMTMLKCGYS